MEVLNHHDRLTFESLRQLHVVEYCVDSGTRAPVLEFKMILCTRGTSCVNGRIIFETLLDVSLRQMHFCRIR